MARRPLSGNSRARHRHAAAADRRPAHFVCASHASSKSAGRGRFALLCRETTASLFTFKVTWHDLVYQMYFIGVKSQSVVLITGAFTGMVLAAQTYFQFQTLLLLIL